MAKILLIKSSAYFYPFTVTYPLGLMYLSAALKQDGGHDVKIIDARLERLSPSQIASAALDFKPDVIGISAMHAEFQHCRETSAALKLALPGAPIILGGPFPSADPVSALSDTNIECAAIGEAEFAFTELVARLQDAKDYGDVGGLAFMRGGVMTTTPQRETIEPLDRLPFPDWDAVDIRAYGAANRWSSRADGKYMSLFTSRSCPYQCIYCHKIFGKAFRAHSAERVLEEIKTVNSRYGISEFEILDDTFNLIRERVIAICDGVIGAGTKNSLSFPNGVRADLLDEEVIKKLKAAGAVEIVVAIESGSERMQKLIKKNLNLQKAKDIIRIISREGILCRGYFMLGFPTETVAEMKQTARFAAQTRLHLASFMIAKPVPGTELNRMVYEGSSDVFNESFFQYYSFELTSSKLPTRILKKIHSNAMKRFYINPFRVFRILRVHPNKRLILPGVAQLAFRLMPFRRVK